MLFGDVFSKAARDWGKFAVNIAVCDGMIPELG
jgi:hypothetical protein